MTTTRAPQPVRIPSTTPAPRRRGRRIALVAGAGVGLAVAVGAVAVTTGAIALGVGVAGSLQTETASRTVPGVREIVVDSDEGRVALRAATGPDVEVRTTRTWTPGSEPVLGGGLVDGVLTLTADCPQIGLGCETDRDIAVPAGTAVRVRTVEGGIDAVGLDTPRFSAATTAGPVTVGFAAPPEQVDVETVAGPVRVTVPQGGYRVEADTVIGSVRVDGVQDPAAARRITVRTVTGPVEVLPG